uniref:dTDP-4-dehydrorhamnose 3,5-epimerase family protein n=1 Tax=Treponema sp. TaxID=166 RepID=UPI00298DB5A8
MVSVSETNFEGLKIIETNHFQDARGVFHKFFSKDDFSSLGLDTDFKESYYSINKKNVIRGMHFQIPPADHTKLVYVTSGRIIDVCLDIRKKSKTYGKYFSVELSGDVPRAIYIPKGFAHGFVSLEDNTCVNYLQTCCYVQECDCGIRYDSFGFEWGVKEPIISARDLQHPRFENFDTPFTGKIVVLTGSTGLIGKEAIVPLQEAGFEVYCLTSKNCNLFDFGAVSRFFEQIKPQYLLHFAWITGGDYLINPINKDYVDASMNMLKEFKKYGGKRVVMAGTCFEYAFKDEPLKESDPLDPQTLYAKCKVELYKEASEYCEKTSISFGWGRIFYVYGHNEKEGRLTQSIISKLQKNEKVTIKYGQLVRDYMYSKDIANAFVKFLDSKVEDIVNICSGKGISLGDFALELAKKLGKTDLLEILNEQTDQPKMVVGNNNLLLSLLKNNYNFKTIT